LGKMESRIRGRLEDKVYGVDEETIEGVVVDLLTDRALTLAVMETNTGGELASRLTSVPGGYSILSQASCAGVEQVPSIIPCDPTPEQLQSSEGAERLAILLREKTECDIGVAIIGDQDPDVGPYSKQTGNTYLGLSTSDKTVAKHIQLGGISNFARIRITSIVLDKLRRFLLQMPTFPE